MKDVLEFLVNHRYCAIDRDNIFLYFYNEKTGTQSILRSYPLRERAIIWKDFPSRYRKVAKEITYDDFMNRIKFTIVRNPWDRIFSAFWNSMEKSNPAVVGLDFNMFVKTKLNNIGPMIDSPFNEQYPRIVHNGRIMVDCILRFERLQEDWKRIAPMIGCRPNLPHKNIRNHPPYREVYDQESMKIIGKLYKNDVRFFGYEF